MAKTGVGCEYCIGGQCFNVIEDHALPVPAVWVLMARGLPPPSVILVLIQGLQTLKRILLKLGWTHRSPPQLTVTQ